MLSPSQNLRMYCFKIGWCCDACGRCVFAVGRSSIYVEYMMLACGNSGHGNGPIKMSGHGILVQTQPYSIMPHGFIDWLNRPMNLQPRNYAFQNFQSSRILKWMDSIMITFKCETSNSERWHHLAFVHFKSKKNKHV